MTVNGGVTYVYDRIQQVVRPTLYPGESTDDWKIPEEMSNTFYRLNSIIENKYSREYLKICAVYNKLFKSLKFRDNTSVTYNAPPFTWKDQERADTGTGVSTNYLKQIIDQVTSRLGSVQFVPYLLSEDQNYEYIIYKDEVERILRMYITKDKFSTKSMEAFHDASVLSFAYAIIDPFTGELFKASDYEVGIFESQLNKDKISQLLYRDYGYPATEIEKYLKHVKDVKMKQEILEHAENKSSVDLCMFFDCKKKKCIVSIDGQFLPEYPYPFDRVLVSVMRWDTGFKTVTTTSLFDLLYPLQREINKINAKQQQLIRNYKGSTPVFNSDVELAIKAITNGTGEALYVDSKRPLDTLMTVINPTPLDPELPATVTEYKSAMYELAGIQNASFDMENMKSAAAVFALDQTRDSVFQAQLSALSNFITDSLKLYIEYNAGYKKDDSHMDWAAVKKLLDTSYINLKPVHVNDPLSDEEKTRQDPIDYTKLCIARCVLLIVKGQMTFDDLPYYIDWHNVALMLAATLVKFGALGIEVPVSVHEFFAAAFVEAIRIGEVTI